MKQNKETIPDYVLDAITKHEWNGKTYREFWHPEMTDEQYILYCKNCADAAKKGMISLNK
jgi:hypothetical protein